MLKSRGNQNKVARLACTKKVTELITIKKLTETVGGNITPRMVRHYHQLGLLPEAVRSPSNYRLYTEKHVQHLRTHPQTTRNRNGSSNRYSNPPTSATVSLDYSANYQTAPNRIGSRRIIRTRSPVSEYPSRSDRAT